MKELDSVQEFKTENEVSEEESSSNSIPSSQIMENSQNNSHFLNNDFKNHENSQTNFPTNDPSEASTQNQQLTEQSISQTILDMLNQIEWRTESSLQLSICIFNTHIENQTDYTQLLNSFQVQITNIVCGDFHPTIKRNLLLFLLKAFKKSKLSSFIFNDLIINQLIDLIK